MMDKETAERIVAARRRAYGMDWPTTPEAWCEYFQALDILFGTDPDSAPLGHNWRCHIHGKKWGN